MVSASPAVILAVIVLSALGGLVLGRLAMDRQAGPGDGNTADEQLRQQAKAIAELSHAVRTPLNSVIGFSEIMRGEMFGPLGNERYRDYADHIQEDAKVLLARVDDIIRTAETTHRRAA